MAEEVMSFIPTKCSAVKKNATENFTCVAFESHKSKKRKQLDDSNEKGTKKKPEFQELNMKQAKYEIIKFGMSGFDPRKKEEAKVQLAIKLGAKPPKNKYKNYKVLQEEKNKQKKAEEEKLQFQQLGKNLSGKSNAKGKSYDRKRRKDGKGGILGIYGKVTKDITTNKGDLKRTKMHK